ncbi:MAG: TonB family protein [Proteobacteria bacterium]|nr:TonB family protein [Pseudomonadota bacterium]
MARIDSSSRVFTLAMATSVVLHAVLLSLHFKYPDATRLKNTPQMLEVVLVNSKTKSQPAKSEVQAQANLDGGGNTDQNRRASTPLPLLNETERGTEVKRATKKVQELEAEQQRLMTQLEAKAKVASTTAKPEPSVEPQPQATGADLANSALALARMQAQINRRVEEYNQRPRKEFIGARAREYRFAQYVEGWRMKVERLGNVNYPEDARGRLYGSLILTVSIKTDGTLDAVEVNRSSGHQVLDRAAERIVRMAAPYAAFPPDIRKDTDVLVITRTWTFAPGDKLFGE